MQTTSPIATLQKVLLVPAQTAAKVTQANNSGPSAIDGKPVVPLSANQQSQLTIPVATAVNQVSAAIDRGKLTASLKEIGEKVVDRAEGPVSVSAKMAEMAKIGVEIAKAATPTDPPDDSSSLETSHGASVLENAESAIRDAVKGVSWAEAAVKIVGAATSLPGDITKLQIQNDELRQLQSSYIDQKVPLQNQIGSMKFQVNGKEMTGIAVLRLVRDSDTMDFQRSDIITQLQNQPKGAVSITPIQATDIRKLGEMKQDKALHENKAFSDRIDAVIKTGGVIGAIIGAVKKTMTPISKALSTVGAAAGVAVNAIKMAFDVRSLVRAGKSFIRSTDTNVHVSNAKASGVDSVRLDKLTTNVHRIARKKVVDKTVTTVSTGISVAAGVLGIVLLASNPIGAAILGVGLLIGVGFAIYRNVRAKRHEGKVEVQHTQMNRAQEMLKNKMAQVKKAIQVPGIDKSAVLKQHKIKDDAQFILLQKLSVSATFVVDAAGINTSDMEAIHNACASEIDAAKTALPLLTLTQHMGYSQTGGTTYRLIEDRMTSYQTKMGTDPNDTLKALGLTSHPGVGKLNKAIFDRAKAEVTGEIAHFPPSATAIRGHVNDLMTRDERMIDDQFRQLYKDTPPEGKGRSEIAQFYSDVSVSQGKSGVNERFLSMESRDDALHLSTFRQFADIESGILQ